MTRPTTLHRRLTDGTEVIEDISHYSDERVQELIANKDETTIVVEQLSITEDMEETA